MNNKNKKSGGKTSKTVIEAEQIADLNLDSLDTNTPEYTSSEELDEVQFGDNTVRIVGYVDAILGTNTVGRKRSLSLFKFIINNNDGRKITVLIWEDQIPKYEKAIKFREIIEMQNVKALPVDPKYNKIEEGFVKFEASVQKNTIFVFHGPSKRKFNENVEEMEMIPIKYAGVYQGMKAIEGYLSVEFSQVMAGSGTCSFASAALTDGKYKLRVQVANHVPCPSLSLGSKVTVVGDLKKDRYGSTFLQVDATTDFKIIQTAIKMEPDDLRKGFRTPLDAL